jgi:hypothetical protein
MNDSTTANADVHVIGGGIGGLAAAALVARQGHSVVVHERRGRLGGRATTDLRGGYRFNQGPHALYRGGEGVDVLRTLGIHPAGSPPPTSAALMTRGGRAFDAPDGPRSLLTTRLVGPGAKVVLARFFTRLPKLAPASFADLTVEQWISDVTDRADVAAVLHAVVRLATYVNAPTELSAEVAVTQLQRGLGSGVTYLAGGWGTLVDSLTASVVAAGGRIVTNADVAAGAAASGASVIVATGSPAAAAELIQQCFQGVPESAGWIGVPATASVLDLALAAPPAHRFVIGVDEPIYLSDHGSTEGMSPPGRTSLSLAHYLGPNDEPDRDRLRSFAQHAGVSADQIVDERYLHRMTTVTAIATASAGGLAGRPPVEVIGRPGLFVVGDWVGRRGHLVDAVLASAQDAAVAACAHLDRRPVAR